MRVLLVQTGWAAVTRSRASAKAAGSRHERTVADYLAVNYDDRVDRRVKTGAKDRGDIGGIRLSPALRGGRVVAELKDCTRIEIGSWLKEAAIERGNDDAVAGVVIFKRVGYAHPGRQVVMMELDDFIALLTGSRPDDE